jgi:uncharacterized protein (TIGR00730 family)
MEIKSICVFCGSSMGQGETYRNAATELADVILENNLELIYGGANVGTMQVIADRVLENGGRVVGVMPKSLVEKEVAHHGLNKLHIVDSMQERKLLMAELSDAFIAMPGGFGTLDELFEMLTFNQLRIHDKPLGILNTNGYFNLLMEFIGHAVAEEFVRPEHAQNIIVEHDAKKLFARLHRYQAVEIGKWIEEIKQERQ